MGFIDWWEFSPQGDTFIVLSKPDETKKVTETGLIFDTEDSVVQDRPTSGEVVSIGPDCPYKVGDYLYWNPVSGMDLEMIRTKKNDKFQLMHPDAILGKKVKDTRTQ